MLPRYTIDVPIGKDRSLSLIRVNIPIRWDMHGRPTAYRQEIVPFAVIGKHDGFQVARILTMHSFYPDTG